MKEQNIRSGTVTAITDQARDPERVNVAIDGEFGFGLSRTVAADHGLYVGLTLSESDVARLLAADEVARATSAALQFLAYRPRSAREVRDRLVRRGFSGEAVEAVVSRLEDWRYVDDEEFARYWVENRTEHKPRGRRLLQAELRAKGVDPEVARQAIDQSPADEMAAALELARKRAGSLRGLDSLTQRRRLAGFLQRRGFSWDVVKPVLDTVLGEAGE